MEISPGQDDVFRVLGDFVYAVLPSGIIFQQGQANRVPEPREQNFVVAWPISFPRLATNVDSYLDVAFLGSIDDDVLTVTEVYAIVDGSSIGTGVDPKPIEVGDTVYGTDVEAGTKIVAQTSGTPGGVGTYTVSVSQTITAEKMACGAQDIVQAVEWVVQMDVHGPQASDNAQILSTLFRDAYAVDYFAAHQFGAGRVVPLYADDPRQMPFLNGEQQYEDRLIVTARLQVNQTVRVPQQFADELDDLTLVAATSPPAT